MHPQNCKVPRAQGVFQQPANSVVSGFQVRTLEACLAANEVIGQEEPAQALHFKYLDSSKIEANLFG